ncbi:malonyl-CoA decarboxylase [Novosphingobium sp. TH158]|uniref:malonyl-CoA decarboxylase n=1 Tax=Novosphingobium sp. TH158 TaxID=2067455 RepID=UPI000C7C8A41|nr:malonyl-CoA decarboxylase [Novosphingobium sp. TH158]PLK26650.1 malonyl-CoA decarboxylase [Novosphingobium sp. TH158]
MNARSLVSLKRQGGSVALVRSRIDQMLNSRFGRLLERIGIGRGKGEAQSTPARLIDIAESLLSVSGNASGPSLASAFFDLYDASSLEERREFLGEVRARFPRNRAAIDKAIAEWQADPGEAAARTLHKAAEARSQKLIRKLNLAPGGTRRLIRMREDLLSAGKLKGDDAALDGDFEYIFAGWFNAGFLELRRIDWDTSASVLERVIRYEAVHSIVSWDDLRARVEPADRRCYAFFHPQMPDDPLIFVEVALTMGLPDAIGQILDESRAEIDPHAASHAIFYSISNCQEGLRGVPFGNFLIKRVVGLLREELPQLSGFATLSPVPGFARWLAGQGGADGLDNTELRRKAADYLVNGRGAKGGPLDPVARFHLGNGARLEAVHADADLSAKGLKQAHGIMVNYLYDLDGIEANLLALSELDQVPHSPEVAALVAGE